MNKNVEGDARTAMPMIKSWPRKVGSWAGNLEIAAPATTLYRPILLI